MHSVACKPLMTELIKLIQLFFPNISLIQYRKKSTKHECSYFKTPQMLGLILMQLFILFRLLSPFSLLLFVNKLQSK